MDKDKLLDLAMEVAGSDECIGFCTHCGTEHYGIEPDAR